MKIRTLAHVFDCPPGTVIDVPPGVGNTMIAKGTGEEVKEPKKRRTPPRDKSLASSQRREA